MRKTRQETVEHVEPVTRVTCDTCGKIIDLGAFTGPNIGHELIITLGYEDAVIFYRQRDFCDECYRPVWKKINRLVGADPDVQLDREYE